MKALRQMTERVRELPNDAWALATLVKTEGSTYRKPGARMLVESSGRTIGVLSGGCLEEEIAAHGVKIIRGAPSQLLHFDTRRLYGCDGKVHILVERLAPAGTRGNLLTEIGNHLETRKPCLVRSWHAGNRLGSELLPLAVLAIECPEAFIDCISLPVRIFLIGTGPEITPIKQLAHSLGWVVVHFAHIAELPNAVRGDPQTAALVMTHNFGRDLAALDRLLPLGLPYLGLLGPRKRYRQLVEELYNHSRVEPDGLCCVHAPAGLDIGSEAPEEIALSIVSEVSAVLAGRGGGHLRDRISAAQLAAARAKEVA